MEAEESTTTSSQLPAAAGTADGAGPAAASNCSETETVPQGSGSDRTNTISSSSNSSNNNDNNVSMDHNNVNNNVTIRHMTMEATPKEEVVTEGSLEPEAVDDDAAEDEAEPSELVDPVGGEASSRFAADGGEGATSASAAVLAFEAVSSAVLDSEDAQLVASPPNGRDEKEDARPELLKAAEATAVEAAATAAEAMSPEDKAEHEDEDVPEVAIDTRPVTGDDAIPSVPSPPGDDTGAATSTGTGGIDTMDAAEGGKEFPSTTPTKRAEEPTLSPFSTTLPPREKAAAGSPPKVPYRPPLKFGTHRQGRQLSSQGPSHGPSPVLSLPIDSLHSIASFLLPEEWTNFGQCGRGTRRVCTEVYRRVRMHGFRCATEVVTAWKLGQHADAKELCALYMRAGVPIYPTSLGHSYHTVVWRLGVEAKHLEEQQRPAADNPPSSPMSGDPAAGGGAAPNMDREGGAGPANEGAAGPGANAAAANGRTSDGERAPPVDPFYRHREESTIREGSVPHHGQNLSYLEEKALHAMNVKDEESQVDSLTRSLRRQISIANPLHRLPMARFMLGEHRAQQQPGPQNPHLPPFAGLPPPPLPDVLARRGSLAAPGRDGDLGGFNRRPLVTRSNSFTDLRFQPTKVTLKIHKHLVDQHLLGRQSVDDNDGAMTTPPVSLSADFFHPFFSFRSNAAPAQAKHGRPSYSDGPLSLSAFARNDAQASQYLLPAWNHPTAVPGAAPGAAPGAGGNPRMHDGDLREPMGGEVNVPEGAALPDLEQRTSSEGTASAEDSDSDAETESRPAPRLALAETTPGMDLANQQPLHVLPPSMPPPPRMDLANQQPHIHHEVMRPPPPRNSFAAILTGPSASERLMDQPAAFQNSILANVDLDVYSATSGNAKVEGGNAIGQLMRSHLKTRFAVYHGRLERLLSSNDSAGFEECILDFWDEFMPQTAFIHYYDRHTAVPRVSCLHKFLTRPCPKAIGTIQCEIERIKVGSKKKGVSMKGRFFPTYEYRLFVRQRPADLTRDSGSESEISKTPRHDTVLMMAKNRGRKHSEIHGQSSGTSSSKKGSNNYYLYLPQQDDVELHYSNVNSSHATSRPISNGPGLCGVSHDPSALLGRLQSNFIGTEFQIFTPRTLKLKPKPLTARSVTVPSSFSAGVSSDEDVIYEGDSANADFPSTSTRRRNRFGRLSLRGRGSNHDPLTITEGEPTATLESPPSALSLRRSRSSGDMTPGRKSRPSRRVSAADALETQHYYTQQPQPSFYEEEDGAITYTANLLGSRPRIMDVCVPKVGSDGQGMEWKRYIENCEDCDATSSPNRMLNHLKQLQQRIDGEEGGRLTGPGINSETLDSDDGYSPPDDFGLLALQNRPPWWNVELGSFVLNFGGRVSVASVKNFQLCDRSDQDYVMLQFGRIQGRHSFTMDFQYPLSGVQAFAIAISSLQSKISFG